MASSIATFLPSPDFRASAEVLDNKRLGKQRVETLQVMRALTVPGYGWQHHPVTAMWRGYRPALMAYQAATCEIWAERGFADTCLVKTFDILAEIPDNADAYLSGTYPLPRWFGRDDLRLSHRSKLLEKAPDFYRPLFPTDPDTLDYVWPLPTS